MRHASLRNDPCDIIAGRIVPIPGESIVSRNPARPEERVWAGAPALSHVDEAVNAARRAFPSWARTGIEARAAVLRRFAEVANARADAMAELICDEVGKPLWECRGEAAAIAGKVDITLDATPGMGLSRVTGYELGIGETRIGRAHFRPHGVMAVVGPFNFPAHLPNGHIVPALLMGNTIVFKPSDKAPAVGQMLVEMLLEAGVPEGVVNLVQGAAPSASALVEHDGVDGILFTGSWPVGRRILEANLDRPGRIVALEMGGNNPAVVLADADLRQAAIEVARCAFNTTGQRCTSTRRLIVEESVAGRLIPAVCKAASALVVGPPRGLAGQDVFIGPIITADAQRSVLDFQKFAAKSGADVLVQSSAPEFDGAGHYVTPCVVRVDRFTLDDGAGRDAGCDGEVFGPVLRISVVRGLDEAIEQANATRFGLAASIFTKTSAAQERFLAECRAGCVNVNTGTAGASGKLPFGGLGISGNHRPAGSFSLDYSAYPVASMIESGAAASLSPGMKFDDGWVK